MQTKIVTVKMPVVLQVEVPQKPEEEDVSELLRFWDKVTAIGTWTVILMSIGLIVWGALR